MSSKQKVAVIGCGVIGLTAAVALQKRRPTLEITIFTKECSPNTTGDVAAGFIMPYLSHNTSEEKILRWFKMTQDYVIDQWRKGYAREHGISLQPATYLTNEPDYTLPSFLKHSIGYHEYSKEELKKLGIKYNKTFTGGYIFTSFTWEASSFLPYLQKQFIRNGGKIIQKEIKDFEELKTFDVVLNCTGLNSKYLAKDPRVKPIRGQIMKVVAPGQNHIILLASEENNYVIPNMNTVILGGTKVLGDYNTNPTEFDSRNIREGCSVLVPAIKGAEVSKEVVGLRPGRDEVRLELEMKPIGSRLLKIVHNYGHGGCGITLAIGCAEDSADLVLQVLEASKNKL